MSINYNAPVGSDPAEVRRQNEYTQQRGIAKIAPNRAAELSGPYNHTGSGRVHRSAWLSGPRIGAVSAHPLHGWPETGHKPGVSCG